MHFANPAYLLLLLLLPVAAWLRFARVRSGEARLVYSDVAHLGADRVSIRARLRVLLPVLRAMAVVLLIVALARPQRVSPHEEVEGEGIDIVLVIDVSYSMRAEDFAPTNRFEGAKRVLASFVRGITNDRLALVVFASQAFTQCPLTLDRDLLGRLIDQLQLGLIGGESTAIGMALATAASRLDGSDAESKVVILLTDGENNAGGIEPADAAQVCKALGVRVYTIGIGDIRGSRIPVPLPGGRKTYATDGNGAYVLTKLDEGLLKQIAETTGGEYHHAADENSLQAVYESIWRLEKTRFTMESLRKTEELCGRYLVLSLLLFGAELLASATVLRKAP